MSGPIFLLEIDKGLEVGFHNTVITFNLAVNLWIEGSEKLVLNDKEVAEQ